MPTSTIQSTSWIDIIATLATTAAAASAAYSAWTSRESARAARDAVNEAKLARQLELEPKLILEKNFLDLKFFWPHEDSLNGEAVYLARKHWKDNSPIVPTFILQNFGQSPALEVTIEWELETENSFEISAELSSIGLDVTPCLHIEPKKGPKNQINFRSSSRGSIGVPLYLKWTTEVPNSAPGKPREIEFPSLIMSTLFAKALGHGSQYQEIVLNAILYYYSTDGSRHITKFRWKSIPFWNKQGFPIIAHSHFLEMPIHPKPDGSPII